jgi:alpha-beta hydrolase superfamily lysophospholipase
MRHLFLLALIGCSTAQNSQFPETDIAFIRGSFNTGPGMDAMAHRLQKQGFAAKVYAPSEKITGNPRAIIGYSLGSDVALKTAEQQRDNGSPPDLVILLDPWLVKTIPAKIGKVYVIIGRGDESEYTTASPLLVIRVRPRVPVLDIILGNINHLSIDQNPWVQEQVFQILRTEFQIKQ